MSIFESPPISPFDEARHIQALGFEIELVQRKLGTLRLPNESLVVCDPLFHPESEPLYVGSGKDPVTIRAVIARMRESVGFAYIILDFGRSKDLEFDVVDWGWAWERDNKAEMDDAHGVAVESQIVALMDEESAAWLVSQHGDPDAEDEIARKLHRELKKARKSQEITGHAHISLVNGLPEIFIFETLQPDFSVRLGFGANREPLLAVIDLSLIPKRFATWFPG